MADNAVYTHSQEMADDPHVNKEQKRCWNSKSAGPTKWSKLRAGDEDVSKYLKRDNFSESTSSHTDERGGSIFTNSKVWSHNGPRSPKHGWSRSRRSCSPSPLNGPTNASKRWDSRDRPREGRLGTHHRDSASYEDGYKNLNRENVTGRQNARKTGATNSVADGLGPGHGPSTEWRQINHNTSPKRGWSKSRRSGSPSNRVKHGAEGWDTWEDRIRTTATSWEFLSGNETATEDRDSMRHASGWGSAVDKADGWSAALDNIDGWVAPPDQKDGFSTILDKEDGFSAALDKQDGFSAALDKQDEFSVALHKQNGCVAGFAKTDGCGLAHDKRSGWSVAQNKADGCGSALNKADGCGEALNKRDGRGRGKSPDLDTGRQQSGGAIFPKRCWNRAKRSRSPSPTHGLNPRSDNWNRESRTSAVPYRDFATVSSRRGNDSRDLPESDAWRNSENAKKEFGERRIGRERHKGHQNNHSGDSLEQRDHRRERLPDRDVPLHNGGCQEHEHQKNNWPNSHHYSTPKERYCRGSTGNYVHNDAPSQGPRPMNDGARERSQDRRDADTLSRQRLGPSRGQDTHHGYPDKRQRHHGNDTELFQQALQDDSNHSQHDSQDTDMATADNSYQRGSKLVGSKTIMDTPNSSHQTDGDNGVNFSASQTMHEEVPKEQKHTQSPNLEQEASQTAFWPEDWNMSQLAAKKYGCELSASVDMMVESSCFKSNIDTETQISSAQGCSPSDHAKFQSEQDSDNNLSAGVPVSWKSYSRIQSRQPLDPAQTANCHPPSDQYMQVDPPPPPEQILQGMMSPVHPNGKTQSEAVQTPSITQDLRLSKQNEKNQQSVFHTSGGSQKIVHSVVTEEQMSSQYNQKSNHLLVSSDESMPEADTLQRKSPPLSSGRVISQVLVTPEEVAHTTSLSTSSTQISEMLPLLNGSLNPLSAAESTHTQAPLSPSTVRPHTTSANTPCRQDFVSQHRSPIPVSDNYCKKADFEGKGHHEKLEPRHVELVHNARTNGVLGTSQSLKGTNAASAADIADEDVPKDGESARSKDADRLKMFKFALVSFIKEELKPAWKGGQLSRDAHKTIVKKVVDKVTASMDGPKIPQTQHKIDHYLSHSKQKLSKLVQAYVAKHSNTAA